MEENLAYDLRQKYAEIVGIHLEAVTRARMVCDYPNYFKALENLYTVVRHKFKEKKVKDEIVDISKKKAKKEIKKTDIEKFNDLRTVAITIANKYNLAYLGQTQDPNEIAELEKSFRAMEMFLFKVMDDSKMFGSLGYNEGM